MNRAQKKVTAVIPNLVELYIKGTEAEAIVPLVTTYLCHLTFAVIKGVNLQHQKVYISTRVVKHLYDRKPAEEFEFLTNHIHKIVKYPDRIYMNKNSKRGDYGFVKILDKELYFCAVEEVEDMTEDGETSGLCVVTAFRLRKPNYLNNYKLLWSWRGDIPSS